MSFGHLGDAIDDALVALNAPGVQLNSWYETMLSAWGVNDDRVISTMFTYLNFGTADPVSGVHAANVLGEVIRGEANPEIQDAAIIALRNFAQKAYNADVRRAAAHAYAKVYQYLSSPGKESQDQLDTTKNVVVAATLVGGLILAYKYLI